MVKRALIFVHRWLGVALCLIFLLWFPSGIGMMYWDFPSVGSADRLEHSPALDPSKVVPSRVRSAMDTIAEGLLVIDNKERIVLANQAFAALVGRSSDEMLGSKASDFKWIVEAGQAAAFCFRRNLRQTLPQQLRDHLGGGAGRIHDGHMAGY